MELSQLILTSPVKSDTMAPSLWSLMFLQEVPKTLEKLAPFGDGVGLCQLCLVIQEGNPISFPFVTRNREWSCNVCVYKLKWVGARFERDLMGAFLHSPKDTGFTEAGFWNITHSI